MFKRFTDRWSVTDNIAAEIQSSIKQARPTTSLAKSIRKEGVRHGKKRIPPEGMLHLLKDAIELATNKLAEEFRANDQSIRKDISEQTSLISNREQNTPTVPPARQVEQTGGAGGSSSNANLDEAVKRLENIRNAEAQRLAEAAEAQARLEIEAARSRLSQLEQQLTDLPDQYRQMVRSCHEAGEFLWNSYLLGYADGATRRGAQDGPKNDPVRTIAFDFPEALRPPAQ